MKTLQIGLAGCGVMGQSLGQALVGIPDTKLAAVYDPLRDAAKAAAEKLGAPFDTDIAKFLSRKRLDGVIVASPPFKHKEVAVAAAKAGKHLFLEKPLAPNVQDCDSIIRAARKAGVKLMVGQVCRYHAMHRKVRDMVAEGAIGDPIFMHVYRIGGGWGGVWAKSWRLSRKKSGGTLMEVNAHEIDFMRFICGDVKSVYAAGGRYINENIDYPDLAAVTLVFKSGAVGFLHSSQVSTLGGYGGRIDGTKGTLHFPSIWGEGAGIHHKRWDSEATFIPASGLSVPNPVQTELAEWLKAIRNNTEPPIPGEEGRAAVQVAEAAYESIETGKPVVLE